MKNSDVAHKWANSNGFGNFKTQNLRTEGHWAYSYNTPIAVYLPAPYAMLVVSGENYSPTTEKHKAALRGAFSHCPIAQVGSLVGIRATANEIVGLVIEALGIQMDEMMDKIKEAWSAHYLANAMGPTYVGSTHSSEITNKRIVLDALNRAGHDVAGLLIKHGELFDLFTTRGKEILDRQTQQAAPKRERPRQYWHECPAWHNWFNNGRKTVPWDDITDVYDCLTFLRPTKDDPTRVESSKGVKLPLDDVRMVYSLARENIDLPLSFQGNQVTLSTPRAIASSAGTYGDFVLVRPDPLTLRPYIAVGCHRVPVLNIELLLGIPEDERLENRGNA